MQRDFFSDLVLVCDMDGTLLDAQRRLSTGNQKAIQYFVDHGGKFTVATGRMEKGVQPFLDSLPLCMPAILYNGAAIYDFKEKRILWKDCLKQDVRESLRHAMEEFQEVAVEIFCDGDVYFLRENEETVRHLGRETFIPLRTDMAHTPTEWLKVILAWEPERLVAVESFLQKEQHSFRTVFSEPQFLELLDHEVSKGRALEKLAEMMGFDLQKTVAMGDNMNDLELITTAGIGVAVENAKDALKKVADFCCAHHDQDAVKEVVTWMAQQRRVGAL